MATREILVMGNPILRQKSKPVDIETIKSKKIQSLIEDLRSTAELNPEDEGLITVGLSAPQIGVLSRIFVVISDVDDPKGAKFEVYINPEIDIDSTQMISGNESCLSTPGICGEVSRYDSVKITYYDEKGKKIKKNVSDEQAVFIQHETDHLDGILWVDRVTDTKTISYC
jgi:peptide deformylase